MQLTITIDFATVFPSLFHKFGLSLIFQSRFAERSLEPRIKAIKMNSGHLAHSSDTELLAMTFYERVSHFASLAKYAVAKAHLFLGCHATR